MWNEWPFKMISLLLFDWILVQLKNDKDSCSVGFVDPIDEAISSFASILRKELRISCDRINANDCGLWARCIGTKQFTKKRNISFWYQIWMCLKDLRSISGSHKPYYLCWMNFIFILFFFHDYNNHRRALHPKWYMNGSR